MAPRLLSLTEYATAGGVALGDEEAAWLRTNVRDLDVRPTWQEPGCYDLTAGSHVGTVALPDLTILIRPKIRAERILFLISYAMDPARWQQELSSLNTVDDLVEGMAALYGMTLRRALARGVQQGYREKREALTSVRGRIRFDDQLRKHFLMPIPLEVTYDDFTLDTDLNRVLYAALRRLQRLPIRSSRVRAIVASCYAAFAGGVSAIDFQPNRLPELTWNRLNLHFRPSALLAEAILRGSSLELEHGGLQGTAFTIDMNVVFEEFVRTALRVALGLTTSSWPARSPRGFALDEASRIALLPDLTWFDRGECVFVGDAKYKKLASKEAPNADLYQLHAYVTALGLPAGMLIYAEGAENGVTHIVQTTATKLIVRTLDVDGQPADVLASVRELADRIDGLRLVGTNGKAA